MEIFKNNKMPEYDIILIRYKSYDIYEMYY